MYDIILRSLSTLLGIFERNDALKDAASLASRSAIAATRSYIHNLDIGMQADREKEGALSMSWAEAASKVRRFSPELEQQFQGLSNLFADGKVSAGSAEDLLTHLERILDLLRDKNMLMIE